MINVRLPAPFLKRMREILADEFEPFLEALSEPPYVAIRPHPIKWNWTHKQLTEHFGHGKPVQWFPQAFLLEERPEFWKDPLFFGGAYYVQEPSGLIVSYIFKKFGSPSGLVADVCASPGGKTIQLLSLMEKKGFLVSAEPVPSRYPALEENIIRWGMLNQTLVRADSRAFASLPNTFDFVLADVPCSGEGMFRKEPKAVKFWRPNTGRKLQAIQRQIITNALITTKVGGYFLYTTCTFNPEENELNAQWILDTFGSAVQSIDLSELLEWNISEGLKEWQGKEILAHTYRFYPHRVKGEGFFLALFKKTDVINPPTPISPYQGFEYKHVDCHIPFDLPFDYKVISSKGRHFIVPTEFEGILRIISNLPVKYTGQEVFCGTNKPAHPLALLSEPPQASRIVLSYEDAMRYLKGIVPVELSDNYALVEYMNVPLGWLYKSGTPPRTKNPLPQSFRLKRSLPL